MSTDNESKKFTYAGGDWRALQNRIKPDLYEGGGSHRGPNTRSLHTPAGNAPPALMRSEHATARVAITYHPLGRVINSSNPGQTRGLPSSLSSWGLAPPCYLSPQPLT